jgi:hypothetical protein
MPTQKPTSLAVVRETASVPHDARGPLNQPVPYRPLSSPSAMRRTRLAPASAPSKPPGSARRDWIA